MQYFKKWNLSIRNGNFNYLQLHNEASLIQNMLVKTDINVFVK